MSESKIKLTDPQEDMLRRAAAAPAGKAAAGLMDGPRRTARKLAELGLGRTYFHGSQIFEINAAGRQVLISMDAEARS